MQPISREEKEMAVGWVRDVRRGGGVVGIVALVEDDGGAGDGYT